MTEAARTKWPTAKLFQDAADKARTVVGEA